MLNPQLHGLLTKHFGEVRVVNENIPMVVEEKRGTTGIKYYKVVDGGEEYRINCPTCGDSRGRLYVNHTWGSDATYKLPTKRLVVCHNEHCEAEDGLDNPRKLLERRLLRFRGGRVIDGSIPVTNYRLGSSKDKRELAPFPKPEWTYSLTSMPKNHPAVTYVTDRGFSPEYLEQTFGVVYAHTYDYVHESSNTDLRFLANRLFIPVQNSWQARTIDPNYTGRLKYMTCPGFKINSELYLTPDAYEQKTILLVEGVADLWRTGTMCAATFGKTISHSQFEIISNRWDNIGFMYDSEVNPMAEKHTRKCIEAFKRCNKNVFIVSLPVGKDPADCEQEELWLSVEKALKSC